MKLFRSLWWVVLFGGLSVWAGTAQNPHGPLKWDCQACHTPKGWKQLRFPLKFNHTETGYPLLGKHKSTNCLGAIPIFTRRHWVWIVNGATLPTGGCPSKTFWSFMKTVVLPLLAFMPRWIVRPATRGPGKPDLWVRQQNARDATLRRFNKRPIPIMPKQDLS